VESIILRRTYQVPMVPTLGRLVLSGSPCALPRRAPTVRWRLMARFARWLTAAGGSLATHWLMAGLSGLSCSPSTWTQRRLSFQWQSCHCRQRPDPVFTRPDADVPIERSGERRLGLVPDECGHGGDGEGPRAQMVCRSLHSPGCHVLHRSLAGQISEAGREGRT
jgi:hypothetical protein